MFAITTEFGRQCIAYSVTEVFLGTWKAAL